MTHLGHLRPKDLLPDPRRPRLQDAVARNLYLKAAMATTHDDLTVGTEQSQEAHEMQRIREVTVNDVAGGTVTVQVYVDGVPVFLDAERPVSGGAVRPPSSQWNFPRGSVVKTVIEADSGTPTGNANIIIDTEPYVFVPPVPEVKLKGKDRLRPSTRRIVRDFNEGGSQQRQAVAERGLGGIGSAEPAPEPQAPSDGIGEDNIIPGIPPGSPPPGKPPGGGGLGGLAGK